MQLISIDVGTLSTKGLLVDRAGRQICQAGIQHSVRMPRPDWAEQDAETVWWAETVEVIRQLLAHPDAQLQAIAGIGISGLFPALLLADERGKALRPALLYSDNRAAQELADFNSRFGLALDGDAIPPKLRWLSTHEPEVFARLTHIFSAHNYIVYRLTGAYCLDYKVADSGLLSAAKLEWDPEIAAWSGIDVAHLPPLCSPTQIVGTVSAEAARLTGLPTGTPVIAGSGDSLMTLVGAGVIHRGDALLSFGTTGWLAVVPHDLAAYFANPQLAQQGAPYLLDAYLLTLGSALQWFRDQFAVGERAVAPYLGKTAYQLLDEEAMRIAAASDNLLVFPYFQGRHDDRNESPATGVIYGLTLSHTPGHIYRALIESFGYIVRHALEELARRGITINRIVSAGGGASSPLWRQIVSNIIGKPLAFHPQADPCLGTAYLTGYALGLWDSLEYIDAWLSPAAITQPSPEAQAAYDRAYRRFHAIRAVLASEACAG